MLLVHQIMLSGGDSGATCKARCKRLSYHDMIDEESEKKEKNIDSRTCIGAVERG